MCHCICLPRISPADWSLFSPQIQCGWSDWDSLSCWCVCVCVCLCACVRARQRWVSVFYLCERAMDRGRNTRGARGRRVCVSHRMHLLYCIWMPSPCVRAFSLIRQIGVDAMRGDERRASRPWQEIRGSSDARLHRLCVAPVSPRHTPSVTCWDTVTLCMRVCLCWSHGPCGKAHSVWIDFFFFPFLFALLCHLIRVLFF